jgi:glycosyltransferase involved in cell wall biosynthesis
VSTRVKVAIVVTRFQEGAGQVALRGALAMDPDRFEVTVVAGSGNRLLSEAAEAGLEVVLEPALRSPVAPPHDLRALQCLSRLITDRGFDIVHTHSAKAGALGRLAAHRARAPRIVHTFHGLPYHEFQPAPQRALYIGIERRLGRITDVALCVGAGVAVEVIRRGLIRPERVRTIGVAAGGTTVARGPATKAAARSRLGLPLDAPVVGAVGRLTYQKAPEHFVAAMVGLGRPDVVGVWVGGGPLAQHVAELAARSSARARVLFVGERSDVRELLPAFDVFALPSRYEGLPVAVAEAMACGVPVVATAVNAMSDLVVPGRTGLLVPPERPAVMAAAIRYLLDRPAEADRLAQAAQAGLGERFSDQALGAALESAYRPDDPTTHPHSAEELSCA